MEDLREFVACVILLAIPIIEMYYFAVETYDKLTVEKYA